MLLFVLDLLLCECVLPGFRPGSGVGKDGISFGRGTADCSDPMTSFVLWYVMVCLALGKGREGKVGKDG